MLNSLEFNNTELIMDTVVHGGKEFLFFLRDNSCAFNNSSKIEIKDMVRFMALKRYRNWWNIPCFGKTTSEVPKETQFFMWEMDNGEHGILIPLVDGDVRSTLVGRSDGVDIVWEGELPGQLTENPVLAIFATGKDPYKLVHSTVEVASKRLMTFRLREDKQVPTFVDHFGWCTWNSYGPRVTAENVIDGLESFQGKGAAPKFIILDDGWQDVHLDEKTKTRTLESFGSNTSKFADGLGPLISHVKENLGIEEFGVWHALEGYWGGVRLDGELAKDYNIVANQKTEPAGPGQSEEQTYYLKALDPKDVHRFYNDYYCQLRKQGVDMVKVDNQSSLQDFTNGIFGRGNSMRRYQEALQGASQNYFQGNTIHCMSNGNDVAFNMNSAMVWRNSDDYYPNKGVEFQQTHIFDNAVSALFSSTFSLPDWDMFQSHGPCAEMHAAARGISGGPVYVTDSAGEQDFEILKKLVFDGDGKVIRLDQPANPSPESIYVDGRTTAQVTKIWNNRGNIGVLGIFHCQHNGCNLETEISCANIPTLAKGSYAVYLHDKKQLIIVDYNEIIKLTLPLAGWEIATYSPIDKGVAPLGLLDKYASAAVLDKWGWLSDNEFYCEIKAGVNSSLFSENCPNEVLVNNNRIQFNYDKTNCLLTINNLPENGCKVILYY